MTIRSVGYDGSIGEGDWAQYLAPYLGSPPMVARPGDFKVSATTGLSVQVAPGTAHALGVTDVSDAAETIQADNPGTGTRYDAVVLRRDWSGTSTTPSGVTTGGRTSVAVVRGGAANTLPALNATVPLVDQPLALIAVTAGASTVQVVSDLRVTHARAGYARSLLAMTGPLGTRYVLEPDMRRYVIREQGGVVQPVPEWEPDPLVLPAIPKVAAGTTAVTFNDTGAQIIPHNLGVRPLVVQVGARLSTGSEMLTVNISSAVGAVNEKNFTIVGKMVSGPSWVKYTGNLNQLDWIAYAP